MAQSQDFKIWIEEVTAQTLFRAIIHHPISQTTKPVEL